MSAMDQLTGAFNELGRLTMKGVKQIHEKGSDAFVVIIGGFASAAFDRQQDAQDRARQFVAEGYQRQQVRIKRIKSTRITGTEI